MGFIHCLGAVELFECSVCHERHMGTREDKSTKAWRGKHSRKDHFVDSKNRPDWGDE